MCFCYYGRKIQKKAVWISIYCLTDFINHLIRVITAENEMNTGKIATRSDKPYGGNRYIWLL